MAWQTRALVIANRTADSDQLLAALEQRARSGPIAFSLLVPCGPSGRDEARARLDSAVAPPYEGLLDLTYATPIPE